MSDGKKTAEHSKLIEEMSKQINLLVKESENRNKPQPKGEKKKNLNSKSSEKKNVPNKVGNNSKKIKKIKSSQKTGPKALANILENFSDLSFSLKNQFRFQIVTGLLPVGIDAQKSFITKLSRSVLGAPAKDAKKQGSQKLPPSWVVLKKTFENVLSISHVFKKALPSNEGKSFLELRNTILNQIQNQTEKYFRSIEISQKTFLQKTSSRFAQFIFDEKKKNFSGEKKEKCINQFCIDHQADFQGNKSPKEFFEKSFPSDKSSNISKLLRENLRVLFTGQPQAMLLLNEAIKKNLEEVKSQAKQRQAYNLDQKKPQDVKSNVEKPEKKLKTKSFLELETLKVEPGKQVIKPNQPQDGYVFYGVDRT